MLRFFFQIPPSTRKRRQINRVQRFHLVSLQGWTSISPPSPFLYFIFCPFQYLTPSCNPPPSHDAPEPLFWQRRICIGCYGPLSYVNLPKRGPKNTLDDTRDHRRPFSTTPHCFLFSFVSSLFPACSFSNCVSSVGGQFWGQEEGQGVWGVGRRVKQKKLK